MDTDTTDPSHNHAPATPPNPALQSPPPGTARQGCFGCLGFLIVGCLVSLILGKCSSGGPENYTPEAKLEWLMKEQFGDRFREAVITKMSGGGYSIYAEFNARDAFSHEDIALGVVSDMKSAFLKLFQSGERIHPRGTLSAFLPTQNAGGQDGETCIYRVVLESTVADSIDWSTAETLDFKTLWRADFVYPDFRQSLGTPTIGNPAATAESPIPSANRDGFERIFDNSDGLMFGDTAVSKLADMIAAFYKGEVTAERAGRFAFSKSALESIYFHSVVDKFLIYHARSDSGEKYQFAMARDPAFELSKGGTKEALERFYTALIGKAVEFDSDNPINTGDGVQVVGEEQFATGEGVLKRVPIVKSIKLP